MKKRKAKQNKPSPIVLPEYYRLTFGILHRDFDEMLQKRYVTDTINFRRTIISEQFDVLSQQDAELQYATLGKLLEKIEEELEKIIRKRPAFYWMHIYRRISPFLANELGGNTNDSTTVTVRNYAEQAILKYASLTQEDGFSLSSKVDFEKILGGMFDASLRKSLKPIIYESYKKHFLNSPPQWVLTDFTENDLANTYAIEGLAYQYWYIGAKMRALGKGVKIIPTSAGDLVEERTSDQNELILSFDARDENYSVNKGLTSNVGTFIPSNNGDANASIFCAFINAGHYTASKLGLKNIDSNFCPNYIPWIINADDYFKAHQYLSKHFQKKFKFGLLEFCQACALCSQLLIASSAKSLEKYLNSDLMFYMKFQRGYTFYGESLEHIVDDILAMIKKLREENSIKESNLEEQIHAIIEFLTLSPIKQSSIGVWSNGPNFVFIPVGNYYFCDYSAWFKLLKNVFFGLRNYDPQSKKGTEFEYSFGKLALDSGFSVVLQSREILCGDKKREVDVAIRLKNNLYLFECRAFERPLNFGIGNISTISARCADLANKLEQVSTLADFISLNKIGSNYDLEWVENIYSAVVSPYTEWIWSTDSFLWTENKKYPRIMSAVEAIEYLKEEGKSILS